MLNKDFSTPLHGVDLFLPDEKSSSKIFNADKREPLPYSLQISEGTVELSADATLIWTLLDKGEKYHTQLSLFKSAKSQDLVLDVECEGSGKFKLSNTQIVIDWRSGTDASHYFQTIAIAIWLELRAIPCIHANALVKDDKCIALIAPSGMGKTTLSAYLQERGFQWLTDDMLALHPRPSQNPNASSGFMVYPSWPRARMWPDSVQHLGDISASTSGKVHERFSKLKLELPEIDAYQGYVLSDVYVLNRNGAKLASLEKNTRLMTASTTTGKLGYLTSIEKGIGLKPINSSMAIMAMLQNSMLGDAYSPLGLEKSRFNNMCKFVNALGVTQIHYNNDYNSLDAVYELISSRL
ncbi:hypothetical protein PN836_020440 [Ningiella sp. W23]|uniref:hypothetical protein n=1 Tax=Ningiella sp. W23 TaxID=3023715 RepID=UPI003757294F